MIETRVEIEDSSLRCFRCNEYDHFARECPYALTEDDSDQEDLDSAMLQMLSQEFFLPMLKWKV